MRDTAASVPAATLATTAERRWGSLHHDHLLLVVLQVLACGGLFNSPAGFIDFPPGDGTEYGHSLACDYTIRVAEGKVVTASS